MNNPYRTMPIDPSPISLDPLRVSQARVLDEVAEGLRTLNVLAKKGFDPMNFSASEYGRAVDCLTRLHDSVMKTSGQ